MCTTTLVVALAVPVKEGVVSWPGLFGATSVTFGELRSTTKLTGALLPSGLPSELVWVACAVYSPIGSAGPELTGPHLPPLGAVEALATTGPSAFEPL